MSEAKFVAVQIDGYKLNQGHSAPLINEKVARAAHDEYNAQGYDQSFKRLHERGGFGLGEIMSLLLDKIERLEGKTVIGIDCNYGKLHCFEKDGKVLDL